MFTSGLPEFDLDDLVGFNGNSYYGNNFSFDEFNWENTAGPSQSSYTGVEVQGGLNNYGESLSPFSAPMSLYPARGSVNNEGLNPQFCQNVEVPSFSQQERASYPYHGVYPPIPTDPHSSWLLTPESHPGLPTPAYNAYTAPQAVPDLDDFPLFAGNSSLPITNPPAPQIPFSEDLWNQCPRPNPLHLDVPPFDAITDVAQPEVLLPAPVASSSGPRRTRKSTKETWRHNPVKSTKKAASKDGWEQALARFRAEFDTQYNVYYGQPSGGTEPATALARINTFVKDDLKRSPLRGTKAGEGKRSRDIEEYLKGLLRAIRPFPGDESTEDDTGVAAISRLADELEVTLAVVNHESALLCAQSTAKPSLGKRPERLIKKKWSEKARRDLEWCHVERISGLFRMVRQQWPKKDVLSFAVLFLLYGSTPFPRNFIVVRPIAEGL